MCGRYTLAAPTEELVEVFQVPPLDFPVEARYNIAPGQDALVVGRDRRGRRMGTMRWGFPPAPPRGRGWVNARGESAHETPAFREAFAHRRCLVPADGFYEWRQAGAAKQPFLFRPTRGRLLALAGIWEEGRFVILTVDANADVAPIHHRMPLVIAPDDFGAWLGREGAPDMARRLVRPLPAGALARLPVSARVNRTTDDDAGLVEPLAEGEP